MNKKMLETIRVAAVLALGAAGGVAVAQGTPSDPGQGCVECAPDGCADVCGSCPNSTKGCFCNIQGTCLEQTLE